MKSELITGMSAGLLAMTVLSGCTSATPHLDAKFGDAVNLAKAQQTINPDASRNTDPVKGIDGQAANASIDRYHKTYEAPTPAPSGSIGTVSGGASTLR